MSRCTQPELASTLGCIRALSCFEKRPPPTKKGCSIPNQNQKMPPWRFPRPSVVDMIRFLTSCAEAWPAALSYAGTPRCTSMDRRIAFPVLASGTLAGYTSPDGRVPIELGVDARTAM